MSVSYLFAPVTDRRKVEKALASESDAVILDLEDGVLEENKGAARDTIRQLTNSLSPQPHRQVWVRLNGADTPHFDQDVRAVDWTHVTGAVLPKAEGDAAVRLLEQLVPRILLTIESVAGLSRIPMMVSSPKVERVAIGTWDLALDLGLLRVDDPDDSELIWQLRGQVVVQSRLLGLKPPIDGVYARFDDDAGLRAVCQRALRMGFAGKLVIHPRQIAVVHEVFRPDPQALEFAREVIQAYEEAVRKGLGVARVRGRAVDRPMVERARTLLTQYLSR
jgi:citrate lyase beta subunit